jgi:hypothetical protein
LSFLQISKLKQKDNILAKKDNNTIANRNNKDINNNLIHLQQTSGNQVVQRMVNSNQIQAKLKVSQPNDPYEIEADRVSEQVMRMSSGEGLYFPIKVTNDRKINRKCKSCEEEEQEESKKMKISRKEKNDNSPLNFDTSTTIGKDISDTINKQGSSLDSPTIEFMENKFGYDFSNIQVHNDSRSHELTNSVNARAFTFKNNIFLNRNESITDKRLMAHELVHVLQQSNNPVRQNMNQNESKDNLFTNHQISFSPSNYIQRRPITNQETSITQKIDLLYNESNNETQPYSGATFASALLAFKYNLISQITAIKPGFSDPDELLATLWTLYAWTVDPSGYAYVKAVSSSMDVRDVDKNQYKCNRFVSDVFAVGAHKGYAEKGKGGKYPTGETSWWDPRSGYPPSANELADPKKNLPHLPVVSTPSMGNIIAFPNPGGLGHTGIYLGNNIYISARKSKDHPGKSTQVDDGLQITGIPNTNKTYRKFI